jgi:hypothetical protein
MAEWSAGDGDDRITLSVESGAGVKVVVPTEVAPRTCGLRALFGEGEVVALVRARLGAGVLAEARAVAESALDAQATESGELVALASCAICAQLPNAETVDVRAGNELPAAFDKLVSFYPERSKFASVDVKHCPSCATAYRYERSYTHDNFLDPYVEDSLARLTPTEARELIPEAARAALAARVEGLYRQFELLLASGPSPALQRHAERVLADAPKFPG